MTPLRKSKYSSKQSPKYYGKPDGYNHTNAIVAFGKPDVDTRKKKKLKD